MAINSYKYHDILVLMILLPVAGILAAAICSVLYRRNISGEMLLSNWIIVLIIQGLYFFMTWLWLKVYIC